MTFSALDTVRTPIRREGWPFILGFAVASLALALAAAPLGWIGAALTAWCAYFFRDPARVTPIEAGLIISPADGLVQSVGPALPPLVGRQGAAGAGVNEAVRPVDYIVRGEARFLDLGPDLLPGAEAGVEQPPGVQSVERLRT